MLFPLPFRPTMPNISPLRYLEGDVLDGTKLVEVVEAKRMEGPLFEGVNLEARHPEGLADVSDNDRGRLPGGARLAGRRALFG